MGKVHRHLMTMLGIRHRATTAYHPQTNGLTERFNGTLVGMIKKYVNGNHTDWDLYINFALAAYRFSVQRTTQQTPAKLLMGYTPILPTEAALTHPQKCAQDGEHLLEETRQKLLALREAAILNSGEVKHDQHEANVGRRNIEYSVGQRVWLERGENEPVPKGQGTKKMTRKRKGPYRVTWADVNIARIEPDGRGVQNVEGTINIARLSKCPELLHALRSSEEGRGGAN